MGLREATDTTARDQQRFELAREAPEHHRQVVRPVALGHCDVLHQLREAVPREHPFEVELGAQRLLLRVRDPLGQLVNGDSFPPRLPRVCGAQPAQRRNPAVAF